MKFQNPLLAVTDMARSVEFYKTVLGLHKIMDFGANVTLTGGVCLQTLDSWQAFIETDQVELGARNGELYFEEENFDAFAARLESGMTPEQAAERMGVPMKFVRGCMRKLGMEESTK